MKKAIQSTVNRTQNGFTLIEMLVAVALVLLMMTLFAQIFTMTTGAIGTQRGLSENNQRARRVQTALTEDLQRRTFRARKYADGSSKAAGIAPLTAGNLSNVVNYYRYPDDQLENGYFYISENDVNDDTDDVLQFTIRASSPFISDDDPTPLFGKATFVGNLTDLNQPEADDGEVEWDPAVDAFTFSSNTNSRGSSEYAEVCYFLRNGNLYRRLILIRDTPDFAGALPTQIQDVDPSSYTGGSGFFWRDFDYAAYHEGAAGSMELLTSATALSNVASVSLGIPKYRFGFWSNDFAAANPGAPIETDVSGAFIGRLTHEETSNFVYPGQYVDFIATPIDVSTLAGGPRRSEDIILANVHSFDIKVFDAALDRFVNLGHAVQAGDYDSIDNDITTPYGNRFDTWHADEARIGVGQQMPFLVVNPPGADGAPGLAGYDDDGVNGVDDAGENGWLGTDDVIPLRAIQITIRYLDIPSNQMRDLTIIHSFADRDDK